MADEKLWLRLKAYTTAHEEADKMQVDYIIIEIYPGSLRKLADRSRQLSLAADLRSPAQPQAEEWSTVGCYIEWIRDVNEVLFRQKWSPFLDEDINDMAWRKATRSLSDYLDNHVRKGNFEWPRLESDRIHISRYGVYWACEHRDAFQVYRSFRMTPEQLCYIPEQALVDKALR